MALALWALTLGACAPLRPTGSLERFRFYSSQATRASWSLVLEDGARSAELLIDGRVRDNDCDRKGIQIRCELRGMFPGGHTVELRLPNAVLHRSVLIGRPWPEQPLPTGLLLVRADTPEKIRELAEAGADGIVLARASEEGVDAAHLHGTRAIIEGKIESDSASIERFGADGVLGGAISGDLVRRFPEARSFTIDVATTQMIDHLQSCEAQAAISSTANANGALVETHDAVGAALALAFAKTSGAIIDGSSDALLALLRARKEHASLREGNVSLVSQDHCHLVVRFSRGHEQVDLLVNDGAEPWATKGVDLLSGPIAAVAPHAIAIFPVSSSSSDQTHY